MSAPISVENSAAAIEGFLKSILDKAGLNLTYVVGPGESLHPEIENPNVLVKFGGRDLDLLMENKAELLLALEQLTLEVLHLGSDQHSQLCFDANEYRMMRMEELHMSAQMAADQVLKTRVPFRFNPMTSRERRVIHLALRSKPDVRSESYGMGPVRQVVIYPADMPTPPPPPGGYPVPKPPMRTGPGSREGSREGGRDRGPGGFNRGPGGRDRGPRRDGGGGRDRGPRR